MDITAKISQINYKTFLHRQNLNTYELDNLQKALAGRSSVFILDVDNFSKVAVSYWVTPKRTRSYPFSRVYDTLGFNGKRLTIIPVFKDEGKDGDRDYLQWDTVALMSLLSINVILGFYVDAIKNPRYDHKITRQRHNTDYLKSKILSLLEHQWDALHWNIKQIEQIEVITLQALNSYDKITKKTGVQMHSVVGAKKRIEELRKGLENFKDFSRELAHQAQKREELTIQPKEKIRGEKATITIENFLGGNYYLTCDEYNIIDNTIQLIEAKHTKKDKLPSKSDIKEGLFKMILFTNLEQVQAEGIYYEPQPILKLTTGKEFKLNKMSKNDKRTLDILKEEAKFNNFKIILNNNLILSN